MTKYDPELVARIRKEMQAGTWRPKDLEEKDFTLTPEMMKEADDYFKNLAQ